MGLEVSDHAALLAPIPEEHLVDGLDTIRRYGKAAYGSRAWQVFRELDDIRGDEPVPVYIYASHAEVRIGSKVTWQALYIGHVEAPGGSYPDSLKFRPESATRHPADLEGHWAVYWHITELERLEEEDWIDIADVRRFSTQKPYGDGFVPEGPIIVGHP